MEPSFSPQWPVLTIGLFYLFIVNTATFSFFGIDKWKSRGKGERISEKTLWILCLLGGSVGALLGMSFFRHKTKKTSFQAVLAIIIALQILLARFLWFT
ncbi:MAG TPA: DUF1294 domain-containing protein [Candidatus Magasanikbacteria bacterium]|nr:MAG: hypothetical protein A3I74_02405 [Candidatus Magasanikbacteria bacterium RIFCSPLOWO2_02_FULL_47_16]OGH79640.1 MAG: hypothetical protein A3C10_00995 [Candidatus Magasanikbacteria bacterium RIFCSPHIGHO2_02_FULL_48_18]OGH82340.1 MAG: hypothetical protein A3G08_03170 [Candidatus Magasanikbacteria bacterium RIFCSPLOWO2_12_FULL_47_9b]HAZ28304.1 DUF1294 domain-containing protein [Candidatus Magasanikbacteria bacterium]